jgi:putative oxidoreductase
MAFTTASTVWQPRVLSVLRIAAALLVLQYGLAKWVGWPAVAMFKDLPSFSLYAIAGLFELIGGALLLAGLLTRPVAFVLSG